MAGNIASNIAFNIAESAILSVILNFPVCMYKSETVVQSQPNFALTHVRVSVTFRKSESILYCSVLY